MEGMKRRNREEEEWRLSVIYKEYDGEMEKNDSGFLRY